MINGPRTLSALAVAAIGLSLGAPTAAAGEPEWIRQFGTGVEDQATAVATAADGSVYVVGATRGSFRGPSKGGFDAFLSKFDRDGNEVWRRQPGSSSFDWAYGVATDLDGNLYVVGNTNGSLGGPNHGDQDAWVIKFDRDGRYIWKRQPGSSSFDWATGVATDPDGNIYVVGDTYGSLGGPKHGGDGDQDAWVIKFDRDGRYVWKRQPGSSSSDRATAVARTPRATSMSSGPRMARWVDPTRETPTPS